MADSWRRYAAGAVVSAIGVLGLCVPLYDMWDDVTHHSWNVTATVVENAVLVFLALGLVLGGVWLATRDWEAEYVTLVASWNVGGAGVVFVLYVWVILLQYWAMHRLKPLVLAFDGVLFGAGAAFVVGVYHARQRRTHEEMRTRERRLRELHGLVTDRTATFDEKVDGMLSIGRGLFDAEFGAFAHVDRESDEYTLEAVQTERIDLDEGDTIPYSQTHCQEMIRDDETTQFAVRPYDVPEKDYGTDEAFEMYVGTPIHVGDAVYGSLCFLDREEADRFDDWELAFVELMGSWLGHELEHQRYQDAQRERLAERKERFTSLVEAVDEYAIFALDSDGHVESWNAGARNIKGYERDEIVGEHVRTFYPDADREAGKPERLLSEAAETGQAHDEGWRVRKDGSAFWADVTITARYDDGDLVGYTKVTRDMTEEREYERALERERERLEFTNRILRHNLLNGLNLVNARVQHLERSFDVDEDAREHVDVVRERVDDMADLIDTMRTFMNAIVSDADHELSEVALREELAAKIDLADRTYTGAEFDAHDLPAEDVRVYGDELVGEVFENVLSNAIQHNDADAPRVEVWSSTTTLTAARDPETGTPKAAPDEPFEHDAGRREWDAITVHVADNGPGIPDEEKAAVLEKGVSGLSEPGNGFGLYLVKEMMAAYGGEVEIRDEDPRGTVVDLTFVRAD